MRLADASAAAGAEPDIKRILITMAAFLVPVYGIMIALMVHVYRNDRLADRSRMIWAIVLFLGNIVAYPAYWYLHIWRGGDPAGNGTTGTALKKIIFFVPLALVVVIIVLAGISGARGGKLSQSFIYAWAALFDIVFFPMLIYCIVQVARNRDFPPAKKIGWICILILFNMIIFPVYASRHLQGANQKQP